MEYEKEFRDAIKRTVEWGIGNPKFNQTKKGYINNKFLSSFQENVKDSFGVLGSKDLALRCFEFNLQIKPLVEDMLGTEVFYTLGFIDTPKISFFKSDLKRLKSHLSIGNHVSQPVHLHSWLTLPSHEIIDSTFFTSYAIKYDTPETKYSVVANHPSQLQGGMVYRPQLVGEAYLLKSGILSLKYNID